jgi:redox-sensitive bicupin YhaK (pirin superfamily)
MTTTTRTIGSRVSLAPSQAAPGFVEATVFHGGPVDLDPFLAITDFHMSQPTFAPHPHAGFSAVTYMFRDSVGAFRNRDSLGDSGPIEPGDLHWTQAASGMMHEEIPTEPGIDCHGMQLFVNLRAEHKRAAPRAFHVSARDVPVIEPSTGAVVRVVVGNAFGVDASIEGLLTPVLLLDISLAPDASIDIPVPSTDRAVVLMGGGSLGVGDDQLSQYDVASFDGPSEVIAFTAAAGGATLLLLVGTPINQPVVFGGPFAMNTHDEVLDAQQRFRRGDMGALTPSF